MKFEFPNGMVCERCASVFAGLELAQDACRAAARGELPPALKRALLEHMRRPGNSRGQPAKH